MNDRSSTSIFTLKNILNYSSFDVFEASVRRSSQQCPPPQIPRPSKTLYNPINVQQQPSHPNISFYNSSSNVTKHAHNHSIPLLRNNNLVSFLNDNAVVEVTSTNILPEEISPSLFCPQKSPTNLKMLYHKPPQQFQRREIKHPQTGISSSSIPHISPFDLSKPDSNVANEDIFRTAKQVQQKKDEQDTINRQQKSQSFFAPSSSKDLLKEVSRDWQIENIEKPSIAIQLLDIPHQQQPKNDITSSIVSRDNTSSFDTSSPVLQSQLQILQTTVDELRKENNDLTSRLFTSETACREMSSRMYELVVSFNKLKEQLDHLTPDSNNYSLNPKDRQPQPHQQKQLQITEVIGESASTDTFNTHSVPLFSMNSPKYSTTQVVSLNSMNVIHSFTEPLCTVKEILRGVSKSKSQQQYKDRSIQSSCLCDTPLGATRKLEESYGIPFIPRSVKKTKKSTSEEDLDYSYKREDVKTIVTTSSLTGQQVQSILKQRVNEETQNNRKSFDGSLLPSQKEQKQIQITSSKCECRRDERAALLSKIPQDIKDMTSPESGFEINNDAQYPCKSLKDQGGSTSPSLSHGRNIQAWKRKTLRLKLGDQHSQENHDFSLKPGMSQMKNAFKHY